MASTINSYNYRINSNGGHKSVTFIKFYMRNRFMYRTVFLAAFYAVVDRSSNVTMQRSSLVYFAISYKGRGCVAETATSLCK